MARHTHQVWIGCDPEDLFEVLMNPQANGRWQSGVVTTHSNAAGLAEVGTTMTEVREFAGYRATIVYRLTELEWPYRAVVEIVDGPLRGTASYICRPLAGGTSFSVTSEVTPQGRWRLAGRAIAGVLAAELLVSCQRLKSLLERPGDTVRTGLLPNLLAV